MEMQNFGSKLRRLRKSKGVTLKELAHALGYSTHSYLSEVESGRKIPTAVLILKVSRYFDVPTDVLMKDECELIIDAEIGEDDGQNYFCGQRSNAERV